MKIETKFTPGRWHVDGFNTTAVIAEMSNGITYQHVCTCDYGYAEPEKHIELNKANAKLIAAAPAMYEALKQIMNHDWNTYNNEMDSDDLEKAESALAQAEGKTP